jgi:hypothetical protein
MHHVDLECSHKGGRSDCLPTCHVGDDGPSQSESVVVVLSRDLEVRRQAIGCVKGQTKGSNRDRVGRIEGRWRTVWPASARISRGHPDVGAAGIQSQGEMLRRRADGQVDEISLWH